MRCPVSPRPTSNFAGNYHSVWHYFGESQTGQSAQYEKKTKNFLSNGLIIDPTFIILLGAGSFALAVHRERPAELHCHGGPSTLSYSSGQKLMRILYAVAILAAFCTSAAANPVIGTYTGGDPGEGLDFQGNFAYAIDFAAPNAGGGQTIGNATFTGWQSTPGATNVAQNDDSSVFQMGTTAADAALKSLVDTGRWADAAPPDITSNLTVQPGRPYLLQLIFQEGWNATAPGIRQFNIDVEGVRLATNFDINAVTGPQTRNMAATPQVNVENTRGAVLSYVLTAGDPTLNIVLSHGAVDNPRIEALTLEIIPEPATLVMLGVLVTSGVAVGFRRRR
jgi:hypothetical protein